MTCGLFWFLGGAAAATWLSRRGRRHELPAGTYHANQERLTSFGDAVCLEKLQSTNAPSLTPIVTGYRRLGRRTGQHRFRCEYS
jgi:hypothetical protein